MIVAIIILGIAVLILGYKVEKQNDEILVLWHYLNEEKNDPTLGREYRTAPATGDANVNS